MGSDVGLLSVRIDAVVDAITVRPVGWVSFGSSFHRDGGTRDYSHGKRNEPDGKQRVGSTLSSFPIDPNASPDKGGRGNRKRDPVSVSNAWKGNGKTSQERTKKSAMGSPR